MACKFRLVTFDVTNTLLKFRSSVGEVYADTANQFNVKINVEQANRAFKQHFKDLCAEHPNFGASTGITSQSWWSQVVRRTLRDSSQIQSVADDAVDQISQRLFVSYSTEAHWKPSPGSESLLTRLKSSGVTLGIISNFDERLHSILASTKMHSYFDFVIASYVVKTSKPNRAIFDEAMQRVAHLGIPAEKALHIGDNYDLDYVGARGAGWNALLINDDTTHQDFTIPDFPSLERRLFP